MTTYTYTTLNNPLATSGTVARGINDTGQIVGWYQANTDAVYGFLYDGGSYATLNDPLTIKTSPYGINNAGHIVGLIGSGNDEHGFLYSGGTYTILDDPSGTFGTTIAIGINSADRELNIPPSLLARADEVIE